MSTFKKLLSLSLLFSIILTGSQAEAGKRKTPDDFEEQYKADLAPALDPHFFDYFDEGAESSSEVKKRRVTSSQDEESSQDASVQIIKGHDKHRDLLVDMINSAKEEILISSKSITYQPQEIFTALKNAINRRVKIFIYADNSEKSRCNDYFYDFAKRNDIPLYFLNIHAKFLIVDGKSSNGRVVIGSHNWLSESDDFEGANGDSSFLISDPNAVKSLRGKTWQTVIKYNDLLSTLLTPNDPNYMQKVTSIQEDIKRINPAEFSIGDRDFKYLTTLQHHEGVLKQFAAEAKKRMVIYSPFFQELSAKKRLQEIFSTLKPEVKLTLCVNEKDSIRLSSLLRRNRWIDRVTIKAKNDFHSKTLKIDGRIRVEGSFNWLSASTDDNSDHHNMETSLVLISNKPEKR